MGCCGQWYGRGGGQGVINMGGDRVLWAVVLGGGGQGVINMGGNRVLWAVVWGGGWGGHTSCRE